LSDHGKSEGKCGRGVGVSVRLDLVKPAPFEPAQKRNGVLRRECRAKTLGAKTLKAKTLGSLPGKR